MRVLGNLRFSNFVIGVLINLSKARLACGDVSSLLPEAQDIAVAEFGVPERAIRGLGGKDRGHVGN